ncbi:stage II sporulation protein P [Pelotomaculum sp. PtaB.Bin117]|uniref:stage II sporulation protein P n=1 Tax=Pelotomaculum sp. PtaB.Bin117 TaxID=1811694 RepID=UPI0009C936A2|nr:stage II sporulation protein P [Pelotomaculum sp. PtaB.Bin117]OPX87054.1 MAG: Stage II sporulation protein P (SpoIIP) [Pelotomaculum sp. PtaB.Bin117]
MYMAPTCHVRRVSRGLTWRFFSKAGILLGLLLILVQAMTGFEILAACQKAAGKIPEVIISKLYQHKHLSILNSTIPVLCWSNVVQDAPGDLPDQTYLNFISGIVPVNPFDPSSVLMSQVPVLALKSRPEAVAVSRSGAAQPVDTAPLALASSLPGETLVLIYNTHSGETYSLTDRVERLDGGQGGVVTAAAALQEALESKQGIKVARSDRIHDLEYNTSYQKSEKTVREMLAASPKAKAVLDIHRDASKTRKQSVVRVDGQDAAPLLFIIGSGARKPLAAGWRQNYTFATKLSIKANELYPGLSLGVRVQEGQYNQFLHPHAVLVEIGTSNNSTEEAVRSAVLFADVLAQVIKE